MNKEKLKITVRLFANQAASLKRRECLTEDENEKRFIRGMISGFIISAKYMAFDYKHYYDKHYYE